MAFRFRRTLKIVPGVRLNLSRSGPSVSFGPRGLHYTLGLKGARTTVGIPGSGLFWTEYQPYSSGSPPSSEQSPRLVPNRVPDSSASKENVASFESSTIEELVAGSTSELAPILNAARRQIRFHLVVLVLLFAILVTELAINAPPPTIAVTIILGFVAWPLAALFDRHRLTITLEYSLEANHNQSFNLLTNAFRELMKCRGMWRIPAEFKQDDWKRNAGSSASVQRKRVYLSLGTPKLIKSNVAFLCIPLSDKSLFFAPDVILIVSGKSIAALNYDDVEIVGEAIQFIEDQQAPDDAQVVGETWLYVYHSLAVCVAFERVDCLQIMCNRRIDARLTHAGKFSRPHVSPAFAFVFQYSICAMFEAAVWVIEATRLLYGYQCSHSGGDCGDLPRTTARAQKRDAGSEICK